MGFKFLPQAEPTLNTHQSASYSSNHQEQPIQIHPNASLIEVEADLVHLSDTLVLVKRTLSDARVQAARDDDMLNTITSITSNSDLINGVYEGGFKTWECSLDLVRYLSSSSHLIPYTKSSILELGCGSALPGLYCLTRGAMSVDFQDYNKVLNKVCSNGHSQEVIELITIPNALLNTTLSPMFIDEAKANNIIHVELALNPIPSARYFAGDWNEQLQDLLGQTYDMILTSETLYSLDNIPRLITLMKNVMKKPLGFALIASKQIYFGCSGSIQGFKDLIASDPELEVCVVACFDDSVRREILRLDWSATE